MRNRHCKDCGQSFVSERSGAGEIQSRVCPECLEDHFLEKKLAHQEVRESWFQLFGVTPPPSFSVAETELKEWRVCASCGERFKSYSDLLSGLCVPCLEKNWESLPDDRLEATVTRELLQALRAVPAKP